MNFELLAMDKRKQKIKRQTRVRSKIRGTKDRPRLSVFRSNRYIYAQIINDEDGKSIIGISEKHLGEKSGTSKIEKAEALGELLAKKAKDKKIKKVVFDRRSYAYGGRVAALAKGARKGGLDF